MICSFDDGKSIYFQQIREWTSANEWMGWKEGERDRERATYELNYMKTLAPDSIIDKPDAVVF